MTTTLRFFLIALVLCGLAACGGRQAAPSPTLPAMPTPRSLPTPTTGGPGRVPAFESPLPEPILMLTPVPAGAEVIVDGWVYRSDGELLVPVQPEGAAGGVIDPLPAAELAARTIAAQTLGVTLAAVTLNNIKAVNWPDASLGCPQPDYAYAQVVTPGFKASVVVDGKVYQVHLDANSMGGLCRQPAP